MARLEESESRIKRLFDNSPVFIAFTEGADHVYTYSNPPHDAICGNRELIGKSILEALPELKDQGIIERFDEVFATGERKTIPEFRATLNSGESEEPREGWFTQNLEPIKDAEGQTIGVATFAYEISDIVEAKKVAEAIGHERAVLLGELQHRVKNSLASIGAISRLLLPGSENVEHYQQRLSERLGALSRTHNLLFEANAVSAGLHAVIETEAAPYQSEDNARIRILGDDIDLSPGEALSIGMAIHELMTNAAKYGSLSVPQGQLKITVELCSKTGDRVLTWQEFGGPPVDDAGNEKGFGSLVIEEVLVSNLEAKVNIEYRPRGIYVQVIF